MAKGLKQLSQLMTETIELMKKIETEYSKQPLQCFDYLESLVDHFKQIKKLNGNDALFEEEEISAQFLQSLKTFIDVMEDYRTKDSSPYQTVLNKDKVMQILADLETRHAKLTKK